MFNRYQQQQQQVVAYGLHGRTTVMIRADRVDINIAIELVVRHRLDVHASTSVVTNC
jgi:hypothetical protein